MLGSARNDRDRTEISATVRRTASERLGHLFCELHLQALVGLAEGATCDFLLTQSEPVDLLGLSAMRFNRSPYDLRGRSLISLRNADSSFTNSRRS